MVIIRESVCAHHGHSADRRNRGVARPPDYLVADGVLAAVFGYWASIPARSWAAVYVPGMIGVTR